MNHSFPTNPNSVTNCCKLFSLLQLYNYIAPASLFDFYTDQLHGHADEVFGLANRKFQLQQSMEERKHEIQVHRDVQRAAHKAAQEERHRVSMESRSRQTKVKTLKSKYESLVAAARPSDGGGEEKSQAYFIIQAAQKREELQREGDELDGKIRRAEREMKALENTLKHLNDRNTRFR